MAIASIVAPCLVQVLSGLYKAQSGAICLTLTDITGNTDFDTTHCVVQDASVNPSVTVPNTTLTAKKWCFTLAPGKIYSLQLVCSQVPPIGSKANLLACELPLMAIDSANQIQIWKVMS